MSGLTGKMAIKQGVNGKSAYEVALDNGFEGTVEEWLESLKNIEDVDLTGYATEEFVTEKVAEAQLGGNSDTLLEYVPVKYLENTGTQCIDTGYVVDEDDIIEVDYAIPVESWDVSGDKFLVCATLTGDASDTGRMWISAYGDGGYGYVRFGSSKSTTVTFVDNFDYTQFGTCVLRKGNFKINGVDVGAPSYTVMPLGSLNIFARLSADGEITKHSYARISRVRITRNYELIKEYKAVRRTADGELGMLETISGEFFTNVGTGTFAYAPLPDTQTWEKPRLTDEQKNAIRNLMDEWYDNRDTFYYEANNNRDTFVGTNCYTSSVGRFRLCCATFAQHILMGRQVQDFIGKDASTYSNAITKSPVSDFGYYFTFKARKYIYGVAETDSSGAITGYYEWHQPNEDSYEGSYSINSYYSPTGSRLYSQTFNGFANANDMARELFEMGCEIPMSELDVGDLVFTYDNNLDDNTSGYAFSAWRNINHVALVYDVRHLDDGGKEVIFIECSSYYNNFYDDEVAIGKPQMSSADNIYRMKGFRLLEDCVFCARLPVAFGYEANVPNAITTIEIPN